MTEARKELSFEKYAYGALAARLYESKEGNIYAPSALELLAGSDGLDLGEEALGFIRGTQASKEGIKTAINVYAGQFEEERGKYKPADMVSWYNSVLADLSKEDRSKLVNTLVKHNESFESINKKVSNAEYILKGKDSGLFKEDQIEEAKKTLQKYEQVSTVIGTLDNYKFEQLRTDAVDESRKTVLKGLASKL